MIATHTPTTFGVSRRRPAFAGLVMLTACSIAFAGDAKNEASAQGPVTAVFKAREVGFVYNSATHYLPCYELENRVAKILLAVGARDDIKVSASQCNQFEDPSDMGGTWRRSDTWDRADPMDRFRNNTKIDRGQSTPVRIRLMMPTTVTPEVLAEIDKDKSRRELVSRVTGNPAAAFNDPVVFEAQRQEVTLTGRALRLDPEDCQLVDQMTGVLRKLDVRIVRKNFSCDSRSYSRIPVQMTVEALLPTGNLRPLPEGKEGAKSGTQGEKKGSLEVVIDQ